MNEEIRCITNEEKTTRNEWKNDDSNFLRALYNVYQKIRTIFSILCSLHIVLFQVINVLKS